jgi:hypothetical protein
MRFFPLLAFFLALFASSAADARMLGDPGVAFSADRSVTVGDRTFAGKLYAVPGRQRHELTVDGIPQVIILHAGQARGWLLVPGINSYVEFGFAPVEAELSDESLLSARLGEETIDGRRTTKYRVEHVTRNGALVDGYVWLTREGIPMRLDGMYTPAHGGKATPVRMELSNLRLGPQETTLFSVPPNMMKLPMSGLAPLLGLRREG